jgi:hypothetical protein
MVARDGKETPSQSQTTDDQRGRRRQQRISCAFMENRAAEADELRLPITVCHLPPGTSKWNKIEHRLFSFITMNWRGKPLRSYRTIVQLIAATVTDTGLKVRAELDERKYPKGLKVSDAQLAAVNISRHSFHGDWNYTISPCQKTRAHRATK